MLTKSDSPEWMKLDVKAKAEAKAGIAGRSAEKIPPLP